METWKRKIEAEKYNGWLIIKANNDVITPWDCTVIDRQDGQRRESLQNDTIYARVIADEEVLNTLWLMGSSGSDGDHPSQQAGRCGTDVIRISPSTR